MEGADNGLKSLGLLPHVILTEGSTCAGNLHLLRDGLSTIDLRGVISTSGFNLSVKLSAENLDNATGAGQVIALCPHHLAGCRNTS